MWEEFVGVRWLINRLAKRFHEEAKPIDSTSVMPHEVVSYFLQLRWATRTGKPVKGGLSPKNKVLYEKVKPLARIIHEEHKRTASRHSERM